MNNLLTLTAVIVLVAAVTVRFFQWQSRQRAREALVAFSVANGWSYSPVDGSLVDRWFHPPFGRGEQRTASHVVRGRRSNRDFVAFEYRYVEISTDSKGHRRRRTYVFNIVAMALPGWMPTVTVVPEGLTGRALRAAGIADDVELESEDFNRAYVVTGNPRTASDLLTPRAMERLLAGERFAWRAEGTDLVSWQTGAFGPTALLARLATLDAVVSAAPTFLWANRGIGYGDASGGPGIVGGFGS